MINESIQMITYDSLTGPSWLILMIVCLVGAGIILWLTKKKEVIK